MEKRSIRGLMEKLSMSPGGSPSGPTKKPSPFGGLRVFFFAFGLHILWNARGMWRNRSSNPVENTGVFQAGMSSRDEQEFLFPALSVYLCVVWLAVRRVTLEVDLGDGGSFERLFDSIPEHQCGRNQPDHPFWSLQLSWNEEGVPPLFKVKLIC